MPKQLESAQNCRNLFYNFVNLAVERCVNWPQKGAYYTRKSSAGARAGRV